MDDETLQNCRHELEKAESVEQLRQVMAEITERYCGDARLQEFRTSYLERRFLLEQRG